MIGDVWKGIKARERLPDAVRGGLLVSGDSPGASDRGQGCLLRRFPGNGSAMIGRVAFGAVERQGL